MDILAGYYKQNMISVIDCSVSFILAKGVKIFLHPIDRGWKDSERLYPCSTLGLQDGIPETRENRTAWLLVLSVPVTLKNMLLHVDEKRMG